VHEQQNKTIMKNEFETWREFEIWANELPKLKEMAISQNIQKEVGYADVMIITGKIKKDIFSRMTVTKEADKNGMELYSIEIDGQIIEGMIVRDKAKIRTVSVDGLEKLKKQA